MSERSIEAGSGPAFSEQSTGKRRRYEVLDFLRGFLILYMIVYHGIWNLVYLGGFRWTWFTGLPGYVYQQIGCSAFILLSGFCWGLGKKHFKRGLTVFLAGALVTAVTSFAMPGQAVYFGILTFLGSCMLLMIPLSRLLHQLPPALGALLSFFLFFLTRSVGSGYVGLAGYPFFSLPNSLYQGWIGAYLGFAPAGFHSSDYFPLLPWLFLFCGGCCLLPLLRSQLRFTQNNNPWQRPFLFLGRHSLFFYLIHQPILFGVMTLTGLI